MNTKIPPLSPHLSIYKPQITSVLSILHRLTGVYLFICLFILSLTLCINTKGFISSFMSTDTVFHQLLHYCIKFSIFFGIFCLSYHLCTGVRYLFWMFNKCMNLNNVRFSAIIILLCTIFLTTISIYLLLTY